MDNIWALAEPERLLLMAASVHGLGPEHSLRTANTARIVNQALGWLGFNSDMVQEWLHDEDALLNVARAVYDVLVSMTRQALQGGSWRPQQRPGVPLFEGSGNWGVPGDPESPACLPYYNSCRLTSDGLRLATTLLMQSPEYQHQGYSERTTHPDLDDEEWLGVLLREMYGTPFPRPTVSGAWLTPVATRLTQAAYRQRAFDRLPVLADALEEAGCADQEILSHCRGPGPHVRGCWVVDLILGKE